MNKGNAKTGRKGDPRMHRAVAARMENPELSLFEALRMGGFDYPADEDASIMDAEKVTLGQRKNQLSRRLRLARKQQEENGGHGNNGGMDGSMGGMAGMSNMDTKMKIQQLQQQNANGAMSSEAQRQLEKLMQHSQQAKASSGMKRNAQLAELGPDAEMHPNDEDASMMDEKNARRMAKFHPQYQPLFIPRAASVRNSFPSGGGPQLGSQLNSQLNTPQLGPLSAPLTPLGGGKSTASYGSGAGSNHSLFPSSSGLLGQSSGLGQRRTNSTNPSGVAVASLSATASSVGLSLEQLAVALSSSSNLVKVLSNNSGSEQQQELALRLFRNESRALYQRCMLLAGFRPEDAEEKSQSHLQFAFSAWQMEGKRLQELMGDENATTNSTNASTTGLKVNNSRMNGMVNSQMENEQQQHLQQQLQQRQLQQQQQQQQQQLQQQQQQLQQQQQQQLQQQMEEEQEQRSHGGHSHGHHSHCDSASRGGGGLEHSHGGGGMEHSHGGGMDHQHNHSHEHQYDGHHVHQLEGKCGHKAIIHQPKDGSAHIDFVVGDKVECYHGIQPMGNKTLSVWPSKYKCEDLSCPQPCRVEQCVEEPQPVELEMNNTSNTPKILDLSDLDLSGAEWNSDLSGNMGGTLLGLFKLGDSDKDDGQTDEGGSTNDGFGISV